MFSTLRHLTRVTCGRTAVILLALSAPLAFIAADAPATIRAEDILSFLNRTITWYRLLSSQQQLVNEPGDAVFIANNRQIADEVVRLSFEFARTESQQLASENKGNAADQQNVTASSQYQNLVNLAEKSKQRLEQVQHELDSLKQQLAAATGRRQKTLAAEVAETEDEVELLKARHDTLQNMLQFASGMNARTGAKGVQAQIEELARTVPAAMSENSKPAGTDTATLAAADSTIIGTEERTPLPTGIFGLISKVIEARRKLSLLDHSLALTDSLADASKALRSPLIARLKQFTQRSDALAAQPASQDPAVLAQQQTELKTLTKQYKQLSAVILPLGKQNILFDLYRRNVANWRNDVETRYSQLFKSLLLRLGMLVGILAIIFVTSHLWRRATFRYIQDGRRRHQFLIVRRIIVAPLVCVILVVAFASGLGSVTVFAGITTAGLAVALQNMIQSIAGYFVLIGKYGVRVGDRVQVAGITGDVIDIGMVRLHLVEVSGGPGARATGRVVAFSNAVVFQPDEGLFKQIPGTNFLWHEVLLTVGPGDDYREVERRMLAAVNKVFDGYKDKMETERRAMERVTHGLSVAPLEPESRLHLTATGTQIVVRYPVEIEQSAEIDDRVTREVLDATGREPRVQVSAEAGAVREDSAQAARGST
ncbi:MAG TPA: hypothetical protein VJA94_01495 [Candidatus Angelobacter sp.]